MLGGAAGSRVAPSQAPRICCLALLHSPQHLPSGNHPQGSFRLSPTLVDTGQCSRHGTGAGRCATPWCQQDRRTREPSHIDSFQFVEDSDRRQTRAPARRTDPAEPVRMPAGSPGSEARRFRTRFLHAQQRGPPVAACACKQTVCKQDPYYERARDGCHQVDRQRAVTENETTPQPT